MLLTLLSNQGTVVSKLWIKVSGVWRQTVVWIKVSGVWKQSTPKIKIAGTWR
jgi:hypothetical protein